MSGLTDFLMREVEMPLVAIVADLEDAGYPVDVAFFRALKERLRPDLAELLQQIQAVTIKIPHRLGGCFDAGVVLNFGRHEPGCALQLEDFSVLGVLGIEVEESLAQLAYQGRIKPAA